MPLLLTLLACSTEFADPSREFADPVVADSLHPVTVNTPATLGVDADLTDIHGTPIAVPCATCHGGSEPLAFDAGNPEDMHGDLDLNHGALSCDACHSQDRLGLKLADNTQLELGDAMTLCAQCHGPQHRDYQAGSHGGMTGHWDLRQGPRLRNHCLDCHGAHSPAIGQVMPAPRAIDRGASPAQEH